MFIPSKENYTEMTSTEFEKYTIAELTKQFSANGIQDFSFQHDATINNYDGTYQIDGKLEYRLMGVSYLTLVECKKYKGPIKREHIQILHDKIISLGAHKGIFVTTSYFQSGALEYAEKHGLALISIIKGELNYHTRSMDCIDNPTIPSWVNVKPFNMAMQTQTSTGSVIVSIIDNTDFLYKFIVEDNHP